MKKLFTLLFLFQLLLTSFSTKVYAQTPKVILQHNGAITLFEAYQLQDAINAAAEGDVIFLGEGTYKASSSTMTVDINKRIAIIGAGQKSIINGSVNITFSETEMSGTHGYILDALNISLTLTVKSAINDFKIRKINLGTLALDDTNGKIESAIVDLCQIDNLYFSSRVADLKVNNSKIAYLNSSYSCCTLTNCNIYRFGNSSANKFQGNFVNCIIYSVYSGNILGDSGQAINSLFAKTWTGGAQVQNCYEDSNITIDSSTKECNYSNENLISKGYLGIDGTVVGIYGGANPFTLVPNTPSVYDSSISVDNTTNKLKVTLKVNVE